MSSNSAGAQQRVAQLQREFPRWMHGLSGMSHPGGPGERVKGLFDTGKESEYGWRAIEDRMRANIRDHGYDPDTHEKLTEPEHMATFSFISGEQIAGMRMSEEEVGYLEGYRDTWGQTFAPQAREMLERAKAHHAQRTGVDRFKRGTAFLDEHFPGWDEKVTKELDENRPDQTRTGWLPIDTEES